MKTLLTLMLTIVIVPFAALVLWMNATPGYFQTGGCYCGVTYLTDAQAQKEHKAPICSMVGVCVVTPADTFLLLLSKLDFNRGPKVSTSIEKFPDEAPTPTPTPVEKFCGGIAGVSCPSGYTCKLDGKYPDAGGVCVKR